MKNALSKMLFKYIHILTFKHYSLGLGAFVGFYMW